MDIQYFTGPSFGEFGGAPYNDILDNFKDPIVGVVGFSVSTGDYIDQITIQYALQSGALLSCKHGGSGGTPISPVVFDDDEVLIGIAGAAGRYLDAISFITLAPDPDKPGEMLQKQYGPYGGTGGTPFYFWGNIMGFYGWAGDVNNLLGIMLNEAVTPIIGGSGGNIFCDPVAVLDPPVERIAAMTIGAGTYVDSITTTYEFADGTQKQFGYGGNGGTDNQITFQPTERILAITGRSGDVLNNIQLLTIDSSGQRNTHGPYGGDGGSAFTVNAGVSGFYGRAGEYIDALGFFTDYPMTPNLTVFGASGYLYTVLQSTDEETASSINVSQPATDLSIYLQLASKSSDVSFTVKGPDGTVYQSGLNGSEYWAVANGTGLVSFYIPNAALGVWTTQITANEPVAWTLVSSASPVNGKSVAQRAFGQLSASEKKGIQAALNNGGAVIPPEICYFCQAQMFAIMGLALATFFYWAGPVTATTTIVLYAQRLLGGTAAGWAGTLESAYSHYQKGMIGWNLARYICELEGMCASTDDQGGAHDGLLSREDKAGA